MDDTEYDDGLNAFDINYSEDELDETESDDLPASAQPAEAEVPADASFDNGFDLPEAPRITGSLQIIQHFRQQEILYQSFMRSFGNGSFISSADLIATAPEWSNFMTRFETDWPYRHSTKDQIHE